MPAGSMKVFNQDKGEKVWGRGRGEGGNVTGNSYSFNMFLDAIIRMIFLFKNMVVKELKITVQRD